MPPDLEAASARLPLAPTRISSLDLSCAFVGSPSSKHLFESGLCVSVSCLPTRPPLKSFIVKPVDPLWVFPRQARLASPEAPLRAQCRSFTQAPFFNVWIDTPTVLAVVAN